MNSSRGFTLIEIIVAMVVMGLAMTALFGLLSKSTFNLGRIEDLHRYELAAEDVMQRVLFLSSLPAGGHAEGDAVDLQARWTVDVAPYAPEKLDGRPAEAIMKINVELAFPGRAGERRIRLESIKPVSVVYTAYDLKERVETAYPR